MKLLYNVVFLTTILFFTVSFTPLPNFKKNNTQPYIAQYENVLGTSLEIKISTRNVRQAAIAEKTVLAEVERLSRILSSYNKESEFSTWFTTLNKPIHVSQDLFTVLRLFDTWRTQSGGALDASAQVVSNLWEQAAHKNQLPTAQEIKNAVAQVQQQHWVLDEKNHTATHLTTTPLRLNSFAKSYIIQSAIKMANKAARIDGLVVNIGGDMVIDGQVDEAVWINNPRAHTENDMPYDMLHVSNKAIATSGDYRRGQMINGTWYSHIINPKTGQPATQVISATVVAPSATDAGALATIMNVLTPAQSAALAATIRGVEYLLITGNGERIQSAGWAALQDKKADFIESQPYLSEKEWKNELIITLGLVQQQGFAKRPFVAAWVQDKDGNVVRNLALWYNKPKWLHDLREWYRTHKDSYTASPATFASVTGATRSAGKYTLKWDGKDDSGNILKSGTYTILVEAAREHGGYDLIKQEIDCGKKPQQVTVAGTAEVESVLFDYKKK